MRYLNGTPADIVNETITSYSLMDHLINEPDFLPRVFELNEKESVLSAFLAKKGLATKGLVDGLNSTKYRVVKSNHVQYAIKNSDRRKMRIIANTDGVTFVCPAYSTEPGKNQSVVYIWFDTNYAGPKSVIELNDNRTQVYFIDDKAPEFIKGGWRYECKVVARHPETFIDLELLEAQSEAAVVMNMYEHDLSETGTDVMHTFDGWGHSYMTLQRVKYGWSGTAEYMASNNKVWTIHNGEKSFLTVAEDKMLKEISKFHEYQIIFGKGTVAEDGSVLMKDKKDRSIMGGDGIMNSGDGAYEFPYNNINKAFLYGIVQDLDVKYDKDGLQEVLVLMSKTTAIEFYQLMSDLGFVTMNNNVEGTGAAKGVNMNYAYFELGGIRLIPKVTNSFSSEYRPSKVLSDGTDRAMGDMIFIPIGNTNEGENGIELCQLRPMKTGQVDGINVGGKMANSVDGSHRHVLIQSGVICRNSIVYAFKPYPYQASHVYFN